MLERNLLSKAGRAATFGQVVAGLSLTLTEKQKDGFRQAARSFAMARPQVVRHFDLTSEEVSLLDGAFASGDLDTVLAVTGAVAPDGEGHLAFDPQAPVTWPVLLQILQRRRASELQQQKLEELQKKAAALESLKQTTFSQEEKIAASLQAFSASLSVFHKDAAETARGALDTARMHIQTSRERIAQARVHSFTGQVSRVSQQGSKHKINNNKPIFF